MLQRLHSTSARLVLAVALAFLAAFLLLGAGVYSRVLASLDRDTREFVRSDAADLLALRRDAGARALLDEVDARSRDPDQDDLLYAVFDRDGRRMAGKPVPHLPRRNGWTSFRDASVADRPRVIARVVALDDGERLLAGMRTRAEDGFLAAMQRAALLALVLAAACGLLVGWLTSRWVGAKLARLDDTARRIAGGELGLRVPADGSGDPFDRVGARLNAMLDRIDALVDGVRHATDHIAHDLRTPLARMRNRLEELRDAADVDTAGRDALDAALLESDRLLQTFAALLRLSRIEVQASTEAMPELDLGRIAADAVELYAPSAGAEGMRLLDRSTPAPMRGDADQLQRFLARVVLDQRLCNPGCGIRRVSAPPGTQDAKARVPATRSARAGGWLRSACVAGVPAHFAGQPDPAGDQSFDRGHDWPAAARRTCASAAICARVSGK